MYLVVHMILQKYRHRPPASYIHTYPSDMPIISCQVYMGISYSSIICVSQHNIHRTFDGLVLGVAVTRRDRFNVGQIIGAIVPAEEFTDVCMY